MDQPDAAAQRLPDGGSETPTGLATSQPDAAVLPPAEALPAAEALPPVEAQPPVQEVPQTVPDQPAPQSAPVPGPAPVLSPAPVPQPVPFPQPAPFQQYQPQAAQQYQPQGAPYAPQPAPQYPMPGQPYAQQYQAQPQQPYQPQPQGQYAPQYSPQPMPGQPYGASQPYQPYSTPPAKKPPIALFVVIGVVVVALIVFCVYWFAIRDTTAGPTPPPTQSGQTAQTTATTGTTPTVDTPTMLPEDAAKGFLQAIQNSDAAGALAFMASVPTDTTFLTDAVLEASNNLASLTNISVQAPTGTDVTSVDVSYELAYESVSTTFGVTYKDGGYLLTDAISSVDLSGYYDDSLGMQLNGVSMDGVAIMGVSLFPGSYQMTVGNALLALESDSFEVTGPNQTTASSSDIVFSSAAHAKLAKAVTNKLKGCLAEKKLVTSCRFGVNGSPSVRTSTINWFIASGSSDFSKTKFTLDDTLTSASATIKVSVKVKWTGSNGRGYYINPIAIKKAYVDFSDPDNIDVSFGY